MNINLKFSIQIIINQSIKLIIIKIIWIFDDNIIQKNMNAYYYKIMK